MSPRVVSYKSSFTRVSKLCMPGFLVRSLTFAAAVGLAFVFSTHAVASSPVSNFTEKSIEVSHAFDEATVGKAAHFVKILPGEYEIGSLPGKDGNGNILEAEGIHKVVISKPFEIQTTSLTQLQWYLVTKGTSEKSPFGELIPLPSLFASKEFCDAGSIPEHEENLPEICKHHPVEQVSWYDVHVFIHLLNRLQTEFKYRLPTQAEWEIVAHAGLPAEYPYGFGDILDGNFAWFVGNSKYRTHAVGTREGTPSPSNTEDLLYDMVGNVSQWMEDAHRYLGNVLTSKDPVNCPSVDFLEAIGKTRNQVHCGSDFPLMRMTGGGSYFHGADFLRSSAWKTTPAHVRASGIGFRLVRAPRSQIGLVRNSSPQKARGR